MQEMSITRLFLVLHEKQWSALGENKKDAAFQPHQAPASGFASS